MVLETGSVNDYCSFDSFSIIFFTTGNASLTHCEYIMADGWRESDASNEGSNAANSDMGVMSMKGIPYSALIPDAISL